MTTALIGNPASTQETGHVCEPARPEDEQAIRSLLRQPMPGRVSIALTHEPDHHAAVSLANTRVDEVVIRDRQDPSKLVIGYGYRGVRQLFLNGSIESVGYLGGLRCDASLRAAFRVLAGAFQHLMESRCERERPYDLTSIMADNSVVRRGLEKGLPGLPAYVPLGEMATLTIRTDRHRQWVEPIRIAERDDASTIQRLLDDSGRLYQGRPAWCVADAWGDEQSMMPSSEDFLIFEGPGGSKGCIALWDQRSIKQVVLLGLSPSLRRLRHAINAAAFVTGRPALPPPGKQIDMAYASHVAFGLDDETAATALIAGLCDMASRRGIRLISIGLPGDTAVLPHLIKRFRPWISRSVIYAVAYDTALIDLDQRSVWMEIATL